MNRLKFLQTAGFMIALFLVAGMQRVKAQNNTNTLVNSNIGTTTSEIPTGLIASNSFTVTKTSNPNLIFDASTPYFKMLTIVDTKNNALQGVITKYNTSSEANAYQKIFDFTNVPTGIYYAKGFVTGASVYYKIVVN